MDKILKEKWVAALRSGEYKQCKDQLKDGGGYCCLGVLCEISERAIRPGESTITLSEAVSYFDIDDDKVASRIKCKFEKMNDSEGKTFAEIADYIEKEL
jgi:hypothetical protein